MKVREDFKVFIADLLPNLAPLKVRAMFGGAMLFHAGVSFCLITSDERLFFKVDAGNISDYEQEKLKPFTYSRKDGKSFAMSYYEIPERLLEDSEQMEIWARKSIDAALRSKKTKEKKRSS